MSHNFATVVFNPITGVHLFTQCTQCGGKDNEPAVRDAPCPRAPIQQGKIYLNLIIVPLLNFLLYICFCNYEYLVLLNSHHDLYHVFIYFIYFLTAPVQAPPTQTGIGFIYYYIIFCRFLFMNLFYF
jgi:hypothetical protein